MVLRSIAGALVVALAAAAAAADPYPARPVRLIVPFPPGGSNDVVARVLAAQLSERLGQQVTVDNRGGAGAVIGSEMAARSEADGYTLLFISTSYAANSSLYKLPYDPASAFTPVAIALLLAVMIGLFQVRSQPDAVNFWDPFNACAGNQLECAVVDFIARHAAPPWSAPRRASRPRYKRDFTVERGTLSTPAISSICNSSWKRRTSTSR